MTKAQARKADRVYATPVYGISDLHLPDCIGWGLNGSTPTNPWGLLSANWKSSIPDNALVLLPGDIYQHDSNSEARRVYETIDRLPGLCKILIPGNHDWSTASTARQLHELTEGLDSIVPLLGGAKRIELDAGALVVAGTCGAWPTMNGGGARRPCYKKELRRMSNALQQAGGLRQSGDGLAVLLHYPPRPDGRPTRMSRMIEEARANLCAYGHVHDPERWRRLDARRHGPTTYRFVAADFLGFQPRRLGEIGRKGFRTD